MIKIRDLQSKEVFVTRGRPTDNLDPDRERGFMAAVDGQQPNLALRYLTYIILDLQEQIAELKGGLATPAKPDLAADVVPEETIPKPAPRKKVATQDGDQTV